MKKILISDFTIKEAPHGGSEWVNQVLIDKFDLEFEYSREVKGFDLEAFYVISNVSLMNPTLVKEINKLNYIIIENDYKICQSRHPWRYQNSLIPINERINYDIYANAKAIFVQTNDHLNVYKLNDVKGNFINLHSSIWSNHDLSLLSDLGNKYKLKNDTYAIYETNNFIKNTSGNIKYCVDNNLKYTTIPNMVNRVDFLDKLAQSKGIVFYPIARETFCRLVVEAKCLGLDVITSKNYGASLEGWFEAMSGEELIDFLRTQTETNLTKISKYIPS